MKRSEKVLLVIVVIGLVINISMLLRLEHNKNAYEAGKAADASACIGIWTDSKGRQFYVFGDGSRVERKRFVVHGHGQK